MKMKISLKKRKMQLIQMSDLKSTKVANDYIELFHQLQECTGRIEYFRNEWATLALDDAPQEQLLSMWNEYITEEIVYNNIYRQILRFEEAAIFINFDLPPRPFRIAMMHV